VDWLGVLLVAGVLTDFVLRGLFVEWYYRLGVRVFSVKAALPALPAQRPTAAEIQERAKSFFLGRTILRAFSDGSYGFRQSLFGGSPLFHGVLEFEAFPPGVRGTAVASVGTCVSILAWVAAALVYFGPGFGVMGAVGLGVLALIEYQQVSRVVKEAEQLCHPL
jgi:hypothetical protein